MYSVYFLDARRREKMENLRKDEIYSEREREREGERNGEREGGRVA